MLHLVIVLSFCSSLTAQKCHRIRNGITEWFCCNNHELKERSCVECEDGYKAIDGFPCAPCPIGSWGRKCRGRCEDCYSNQRCDRVKGCITRSIEVTTYRVEPMTGMTEIRNEGHTDTFSVNSKEDNTFLLPRETIIYTTGAIVFILVSVVCAICFYFKEKISKFFQKTTTNQVAINEGNIPDSEQIESHYISLDEINTNTPNLGRSFNTAENVQSQNSENVSLINNTDLPVVQVHHTDTNVIPSTPTLSTTTDDGYLHPCEQNVSGQSCQKDIQWNSDGSNSTSDSEISNQNKGYLHPYQPVVQYLDLRVYEQQSSSDRISDKYIEPEKQMEASPDSVLTLNPMYI